MNLNSFSFQKHPSFSYSFLSTKTNKQNNSNRNTVPQNFSKMTKNIIVMCDRTWNNGIGIGELAFNFIIDGAIAVSLDKKIKEVFGFSHDAYTTRCIAGLIRNCDILKRDRDTTPDQIDKLKSFSYSDTEKPIIKFLGLWDTVSAYDLPAYVIGEGFI
ncbi:hypothetical protein C1645_878759 [Glomus cerebriforme]|uniref:Uncharacterized protein n=1 Tax=Glomus cerebriforme TaxID=658196 RepID=A0A397SJG0_9GLOM|nr:hypothetical protein C1645_878759 [Glomus cerebriforme]